METIDKYSIVENHTSTNSTFTSNYIESYIMQLMDSKNKIIISNYIIQINWFKLLNQEYIINIICTTIKKYLITKRKDMRDEIKKSSFNLEKFISFLEIFKNKIKSIQVLFIDEINISKFRKPIFTNLSKLFITDSIILSYIKYCFESYDLNNKPFIIKLYNICDIDIGIYDKHKTMDKLLLTITESINVKQIIKLPEFKLPSNITNIYNIKLLIDYIDKINNYYNFITKNNIDFIISNSISNEMFNQIINTITNNNDNIIYIFENCPSIYDIIIYNKNIFNLCVQLVNIIDRYSNLQVIDCIKLIKIIKIINTIYEKIHLNKIGSILKSDINIHTTKIFMILSSNLNNIVKTIDILIKETNINYELIKPNIKIIKDIIYIIYNKGNNSKLHLDYYQQFIELYYDYLIKRCLNSIKYEGFNIEKIIVNQLDSKFGKKLTYKLNLVINDYINNNQQNKVYVGSYDAYPINYSVGYISNTTIETRLGKIINNYENDYLINKPNRKLNWYLHYGEIEVTYLDKQLKLLPIQLLILEHIEIEELITIEKLFTLKILSNYTKEYINNLVQSIVAPGLVKNINHKLSITTDKDDIYETDLIDIFFNNLNYKPIKKEFVHSKKDIINATINHYLKKSQLNKLSLYNKIKDDISLFEVKMTDYDESLDYMIKMDYIKLDNGLYEKLLF